MRYFSLMFIYNFGVCGEIGSMTWSRHFFIHHQTFLLLHSKNALFCPAHQNKNKMSTGGWVKLYKNLINWEWYSDSNTTRVFLHILLNCEYETTKRKGRMIPRGSWLNSSYKIAEALGLSRQNVRTALANLQSTHELTHESTQYETIYTLVNYEQYQGVDDSPHPRTNPQEDEKSTRYIEKNKELKNNKKEKVYSWQGNIIKLNKKDFDDWSRNYSNINLPSELQRMDSYYSENGITKNWFNRLNNALANKNAQAPKKPAPRQSDAQNIKNLGEIYEN